jgi:hypothetical protein
MCIKAGDLPGVADRHFYLYAKNHYQNRNMVEDLKTIMAKYSGLKTEDVVTGYVVEKLLELAYYHINTQREFTTFVMSILEVPTNDTVYGVIKACIVELAMTKVVDIPFELGEPDPEILPVSQPYRKADTVPDGY